MRSACAFACVCVGAEGRPLCSRKVPKWNPPGKDNSPWEARVERVSQGQGTSPPEPLPAAFAAVSNTGYPQDLAHALANGGLGGGQQNPHWGHREHL